MRGIMMRFCESCGSEVPEGASFCGNCGQAARRNGGYGAPGERIAGPENNLSVTNSPKRPTRRPYQYSPPLSQQDENRQLAGGPTVSYTPRTSMSSPVQQTPPVAPAAGPGAQ